MSGPSGPPEVPRAPLSPIPLEGLHSRLTRRWSRSRQHSSVSVLPVSHWTDTDTSRIPLSRQNLTVRSFCALVPRSRSIRRPSAHSVSLLSTLYHCALFDILILSLATQRGRSNADIRPTSNNAHITYNINNNAHDTALPRFPLSIKTLRIAPID